MRKDENLVAELPSLRSGFTFEGPDDVFRNPPAVESAELCLNTFFVDVTAIHQVRIE